ncbi:MULTISPECIES: hypothetical protein [Helicobacter]|uniref:Uncharacterized protein n=1 Tax=Helicobacter ganmani TaxID=60246 RepID=A0A3D8IGJ3_9HELI|nr:MULTISPECIES: hypothetical protein [Helicobacter]RDU63681.1 hypothetical protein CQA43_02325 [Helicobacter ganmani]
MDKKFCIISLAIPLFVGLFLVLILYFYDPFLLYHKPYFREETYSDDIRMQAKGIIKHYNFDSYILGTSMLANTSAKEAKEKLGGEWVNLSLAGSSLAERALVLNYALRKKPIKSVILSLDAIVGISESGSYFAFLYDNNELNDLKIYFNGKFIKCALSLSNSGGCKMTIKDTEELASFRNDEQVNKRLGGIQNWFVDYKNVAQLLDLADVIRVNDFAKLQKVNVRDISNDKKYLDKFLLTFVRDYPQTNFYFIVPPYSRLNYNVYRLGKKPMTNSEYFYTWVAVLTWLIGELEAYPNTKIYGFDTLDYADNIANYSDLVHYNIDMNSMQLDAIRDNTHRLTSENIEEYLKIMKQKIQEYDVEPLVKIAKEALGEE